MERIGIAASKIAKGNLFLYNFFVFLLIFLFSLIIFFVAGSSIVVVIIVIAYARSVAASGGLPDLQQGWIPLMVICLKILAAVIGLLALCALGINIRFRKHE